LYNVDSRVVVAENSLLQRIQVTAATWSFSEVVDILTSSPIRINPTPIFLLRFVAW